MSQNQLISSIAQNIKFVIKKNLNISKVFSISIYSTFELSGREHISFIIKYFDNNSDYFEWLLALKYSAFTTGVQFNIFEEVCFKLSVDWTKFLVGQSYDGA